MQYIENKTYDEIAVGDRAELTRTLNAEDVELFSVMSGDASPAGIEAGAGDAFHKVISQGMWGGALISGLLGTELPGPGTIYRSQTLRFCQPVGIGDTVTVTVTVRSKGPDKPLVTLDCECRNQDDEVVVTGSVEVEAPLKKVRRPQAVLPEIHLHTHGAHHARLLQAVQGLAPITMAVVHPVDDVALGGAVLAAQAGLIEPLLVGPRAKILKAAEDAGLEIGSFELVDVPHSHAAAATAVRLAREGKVQSLMKGALHTDELMSVVVAHDSGLATERRMSHVFVMDAPTYPRLLLITDAAVNIAPGLDDKRDIVQNAIELAAALGVEEPKVAILSAVETVNSGIRSTVEAAALCKMADRGQIRGGILDGPLAFDNAISAQAAASKSIHSPVAGCADILVVPDIESGNMLAKQLEYLAGADTAGIVLGARVPIVLTSRADREIARKVSCAVACLLLRSRLRWLRGGP